MSTTAGKRDSLSISLLGSSDTNNLVTGEDFKRWWINTFLVDDNEVLVGAITEFPLELDNLLDFVISEGSLGLDKLLSLLGVGPEEAGVDLGLFILE